jgi:hypothetical protein
MKSKLYPLLALASIVSAFLFAVTATAYAAADIAGQGSTISEKLSVEEVWLTGDTLHITVTDKNSGESQDLQLNLSEYAKPADEYVTVQATDSSGQTSNPVQFKNPYYAPQANTGPGGISDEPEQDSYISESAIAEGENPFTPAGTGTVLDNATDGDGKEFFTVETPDGNTFYLIVDRQRYTDNVYLLNAVTEDDLASLAKPGDGKGVSAVDTPAQPPAAVPPEIAPDQAQESPPAKSGGSNTGAIVFMVIAVIGVGGAGYYIKIVRPKKLRADDGYDYGGEAGDYDDDEEIDVPDDEGDDDV